MKSKLKIACIGEAMVELSINPQSDIALGFAGDTLNTAIYLKRLLADQAEVSYCTVLGRDPLSVKLEEFIRSESIDTDCVNYSDNKTVGLYAIATNAAGERSFSYWRNDSAARTLFQTDQSLDFSLLNNFEVLYLSAITLAILPDSVRTALHEHIVSLRASNNTIFVFDSNYRPALWESQESAQSSVASFWKIADIALPSIDDEQDLFNESSETEVLSRMAGYGVKSGALKRGEQGPLSLNPQTDNMPASYPAIAKVVDSTAAGDSFNAGYLSAALTGKSDTDALQAGHACASRVISYRGAIVPPEEW